MNKQDILAMEPGRELDALVAEEVLGFRFEIDKVKGSARWIGYGAFGESHTPPMAWRDWDYKVPPYSTDISAAWEVVEKMHEWGGCDIGCYGKGNQKWFSVSTFPDNGQKIEVTKHTAPEAICKAALIAVMEGETDE